MGDGRTVGGGATTEAWALVRSMLDDMAAMVATESETELELIEGYRALGRITALAAEVSLDVDPELPWFFPMNSPARMVGRPEPRRRLPPGHDRRGAALPGDGHPQLGHVPRLPGARRTRA